MPVLVCAILVGCQSVHHPDEWVSLFDGDGLDGWVVQCPPADKGRQFWNVEDSAIVCDSMGRGNHDYVWLSTVEEFDDFELRLKVQTYRDSAGNSGVQVRSRYDEEALWLDGPQVDIHPPGPWRTGHIYDETREVRRWIYPGLPNSAISESDVRRSGAWEHADEGDGWNEVRIVCKGTTIKTFVNGVLVADFDGAGILDDAAHRLHNVGLRGRVALQLHRSDDEIRIRFKDIRIRRL